MPRKHAFDVPPLRKPRLERMEPHEPRRYSPAHERMERRMGMREHNEPMGDAVKGITDVAKIGMIGGVTVGILGAFQK